jgi:hypothetical protein
MVTGDFNDDGTLDLVVLENDGYSSKSISLFWETATARFTQQAQFSRADSRLPLWQETSTATARWI